MSHETMGAVDVNEQGPEVMTHGRRNRKYYVILFLINWIAYAIIQVTVFGYQALYAVIMFGGLCLVAAPFAALTYFPFRRKRPEISFFNRLSVTAALLTIISIIGNHLSGT